MKQQIKEWYKKWFGEPAPNLYIVDGVEMTWNDIVQKARTDVGGKLVVEGEEFSCLFFVNAEKWEKKRQTLFWLLVISVYIFAFTMNPLITAGYDYMIFVELAILGATCSVGYYKFKKRRAEMRIQHGIEDLEFQKIVINEQIKQLNQEIDELKEKRETHG